MGWQMGKKKKAGSGKGGELGGGDCRFDNKTITLRKHMGEEGKKEAKGGKKKVQFQYTSPT